jgi:O-antigen/teichoic acid export membrane protein
LVVDWTLATHYVRSGLLFTINGFLYLCTRSVDRILILAVLGTTALGWYGLAIFAAGYVELAAQALGRAMYPHMVGEFEADGDHEVMRPYVTQVNLALGLLVPCATGLAALVLPPLVTAILPRYVPGIMAAQILMLSAPFVVVRYTASYYFVATATIERTFKVQMVATVVAAGACAAALAAGMGTGGAALGMALANLVSAVGFLSLALDSFGVTRVRVTAFAGRVLLPSFYVGGSVAVLEAMPVNWVGGVGVGSVLGQSACLLVLCSPLLVAGWRVAAPFLFHSRSTWATA